MARAYTIRDFPEALHRRAKATAALEGVTLKELILIALAEYVESKQGDRTQSKPTLEELLQRCEDDTGKIIGMEAATRISKWREHQGNYLRLIPFVQWRLNDEKNLEYAKRLDQEGGLSLERIALDYYPEFFHESDLRTARRTLGVEG